MISIYKIIKSKLECTPRTYENPNNSFQILIPDCGVLLIEIENNNSKVSFTTKQEFIQDKFNNHIIIDEDVFRNLLSNELMSLEYIEICIASSSIKVVKATDLSNLIQIFTDFPFDDITYAIEVNDRFDIQYSTKTSGREDNYANCDNYEKENYVGYAASQTSTVRFVLGELLNIDYSQFRFIELGCGKGRVVTLASFHPFKVVTGVEYLSELAEASKQNIDKISPELVKAGSVEILNQNAINYNFIQDNLVIYLYEPFHGEIFSNVLKKIYRCYQNKNDIIIVLQADGLVDELKSCEWLELTEEGVTQIVSDAVENSGWLIEHIQQPKMAKSRLGYFVFRSK